LAGCGNAADSGSDQKASTAASASTSVSASASASAEEAGQGVLTPAQAKAALPTAADLPTGWTVKAIGPEDTARAGDATKLTGKITYQPAACQALYDKLSANNSVAKAATATKAAAVATPASGYGTTASFSISSYKTTADSEEPLKAVSDLGACKTFTATTKLGTYRYAVSPLTPPSLGDDQAGWSMTMTVNAVTVHLTFVTIRVGHNLVTAVETATTAAPPLPYEPVLKSILGKLKTTN
jgi:hypothetical protein